MEKNTKSYAYLQKQQEADRLAFEALPIEEQKKYIAIREENVRKSHLTYTARKKKKYVPFYRLPVGEKNIVIE